MHTSPVDESDRNALSGEGQQHNPLSFMAALILLLWVVFVVAVYFVVHKPWGGGQPWNLVGAVIDLVLGGALVSLAGATGERLLRGRGVDKPLERPILAAALGLGGLSLATLAVGLFGLLFRWLAYAALAGGLILLRREVTAWWRGLGALLKPSPERGRLDRITFGFVTLLLAFNLLRALAPPVMWDSLVYHLELPKQYLAHGRIFFTPENFYGGFPLMAEMGFLWAMALRGATTATVLCWAVGGLALCGVEAFARRLSRQATHWLAPAVLLSGSTFSHSLSWAYVDLYVMLFGLGMWFFLLDYVEDNHRRDLVLAGVMAGLAIGTKYTSAILVALAGIALLYVLPRRRGIQRVIVDGMVLGCVALLVTAPWLLKNWALAGSPVYPFVSFDREVSPWRQTFRGGPAPERSLLDDLVMPADATLFGIESAVVVGRPEYSASLGPLMLALIPGLLVGWKTFDDTQRRRLKLLLVIGAGTWLVWAVGAHVADELMRPRHYFGIFSLLAVLAGAGFEAASGITLPGVRIGRVLAALTGFALLLSGLAEVDYFASNNPLAVVMGKQSQPDFLRQELGVYADAMDAVNGLPQGAVVLFLWEPRIYYCQQECISDSKIDNWWALRQTGGDTQGIVRLLAERGITHVLIYDAGVNMLVERGQIPAEDWQALADFRTAWLEPLREIADSYSLSAFRGDSAVGSVAP